MKVPTMSCPLTILSSHHTVLVLACGLCMACVLSGIGQAENPVPLINQPLVPDRVAPGGSGFTLTVNGTGFVSRSVVNWNGSALLTTFVSGSQLKASVPASNIANAGTASVTVVSPGAGDEMSNTVFFPVAPSTFIVMSGSDYSVGTAPPAVSTADLNGDGKQDLIATNSSDNTVSVLLGNGDGTFQTQVTYAVGENPRDIAIADFTRDGKLDLAVTNTNSNTVSILLGNGDGTFQPQVQFGTGTGAYGIAAADVNGDGKLDLVVTNSGSHSISVLLGNGDGTFQAAVNYRAGTDPRSVAVGDFNGDGKLDLAVTNFDTDNVSVLLGNGDGTFSAPTSYSAGSGTRFVTTADFNGDGKLDLAVANQFDSTISILLGNGDGTFQPQVIYASVINPTFVGVGDFNGGGNLDLATADYYNSPAASILLGNGDGTFQPHMDYYDGQTSDQLAIGDFNGDGRLDLAAANQFSNTVSILMQVGTINLSPASVNFGVQVNSSTENVTLTNVGTSTLSISSIAITGSDPEDFSEKSKCGASLPPRGHCAIGVTFTPTQLGPRTAALSINDSAPGSPQSITLNGFGANAGPNATFTPTSLRFATLLNTTSSPMGVTLTNNGTATLNITSIIATGDFGQTNNCVQTVAPEASCTIQVTFTPKTIGKVSGMLSITDNAPGSPQTVSLAGVGTEVELNPSSLLFRCGAGSQQTKLTNVGNSTLRITRIVIKGSDTFSQKNTCGSDLGAGTSCIITVTYNGGSPGGATGNVSISDDGGGSPQKVGLSAVGRCGP